MQSCQVFAISELFLSCLPRGAVNLEGIAFMFYVVWLSVLCCFIDNDIMKLLLLLDGHGIHFRSLPELYCN